MHIKAKWNNGHGSLIPKSYPQINHIPLNSLISFFQWEIPIRL